MITRSPLYRMEAYGLQNVWVLWGIKHGGMNDSGPEPVHLEDFGDRSDLELAQALFPGMQIAYTKRTDMEARAL